MIERNGGGEGNCLLLVEATHELRPEEGEGDTHGENWGRGGPRRMQSRTDAKALKCDYVWCAGGIPRRLVWWSRAREVGGEQRF